MVGVSLTDHLKNYFPKAKKYAIVTNVTIDMHMATYLLLRREDFSYASDNTLKSHPVNGGSMFLPPSPFAPNT